MEKILSLFLALSMIVTMLPIPAMAEEVEATVSERGEIITFLPLAEAEKTVMVGTSLEDLELPESLTVTVQINPETVADSLYDSEDKERTVDIPVAWSSQPEYDMDTEGEYVFTPVIEGYIVNTELPRITVVVRAVMMRQAFSLMSGDNVAQNISTGQVYPTLQGAVDEVKNGETIQLLEDIVLNATVTIGHKSFTLDLNGKTLDSGDKTAIQYSGNGILTIDDSSAGGKGRITGEVESNNYNPSVVRLTGSGTLNIKGGMVEATGVAGCTINLGMYGNVNVSGEDGANN
jgi:hypothetical protein